MDLILIWQVVHSVLFIFTCSKTLRSCFRPNQVLQQLQQVCVCRFFENKPTLLINVMCHLISWLVIQHDVVLNSPKVQSVSEPLFFSFLFFLFLGTPSSSHFHSSFFFCSTWFGLNGAQDMNFELSDTSASLPTPADARTRQNLNYFITSANFTQAHCEKKDIWPKNIVNFNKTQDFQMFIDHICLHSYTTCCCSTGIVVAQHKIKIESE